MAYASDEATSGGIVTIVPDNLYRQDQANQLQAHFQALGDPTAAYTQAQVAKFRAYTSGLGSQLDQTAAQARQTAQNAATGGADQGRAALVSYARQAAQRAGVDPDIFTRQIQEESGFSPTAHNP